jgi:tetratricopeptide (TPR) repeat protein
VTDPVGPDSVRDRLLDAVRVRLDAVATTGDYAAVQDPQALSEAEGLLVHVADADGVDEEIFYAVGLLHWLRSTANPHGQDRASAVFLLTPLYLSHPDVLPETVASVLTRARNERDPRGEQRVHEYAETLSNLGSFLLDRLRNGQISDGEAAIHLFRHALDGLSVDHPSYPLVECNLGYALLQGDFLPHRHDEDLPLPRLDECVAVFRDAFAATPEDSPHRSRCAYGFGAALRAKATQEQNLSMLDQAIDAFRVAVQAASGAEENYGRKLTDFGSALLWRSKITEDTDPALLDEAVEVLRRAVALGAEHRRDVRERQGFLAEALRLRHQRGGTREDLHTAIALLRQALDTEESFPQREQRAELLIYLGESLVDAYDCGVEDASLEEATELLNEAANTLPSGHPRQQYVRTMLTVVEYLLWCAVSGVR